MHRLTICLAFAAALGAEQTATKSHIAFTQALPMLDGKHAKVSVVEVTYPPGASSTAHSHPCPVIVYVLDGAVRMQVKGELEAQYKTGEFFYEAPNGVHQVSANASHDRPARFLAFFVCDRETSLSVPAPAGSRP